MSDERMAPVQGYSAGIPWSLHLRAWDAYAAKYGRYQSAERIAERAGFSVGELDAFVPGWRDEVSEIAKLRAEVARLRGRIQRQIDTTDGAAGENCRQCLREILAGAALAGDAMGGE